MPVPLSVVVLTYNEERNIARCLGSVAWADEILVVDSFSTDTTLEIAGRAGARILQHPYDGYSRQLEFGVANTNHQWILVLDADEEVSSDLQREIQTALDSAPEHVAGYEIPRHVYFLGRWIDHGGWYPDYQFRLFRKGVARPVHREIHSGYVADGAKERLRGRIFHYTYRTLYDYLHRINQYTTFEVANRIREKRTSVHWYNLLLNPLSYFLRMFFVHRGYRDRFPGFILALFSAFYTLALYAKLWEYRNSLEKNLEHPPVTNRELSRYTGMRADMVDEGSKSSNIKG